MVVILEEKAVVVRSVNLRVPVTALASVCHNNRSVTLVGQGRCLSACHHQEGPRHRLPVFRGSSIHAIKPLADGSLLVTGAKSVARLELVNDKLVVMVAERVLSDWIWDSGQSDDRLLFLTAHNRVVLTSMDLEVKMTFSGEEQCILYSGLLRNSQLI